MATWRRVGALVIVSCECATTDAHDLSDAHCSTRCGSMLARGLSLAEAYFMIAEERTLALPSTTSLADVWQDFERASACFVSHVIALFHFKRLGWQVQSGLNYGAQFVLYRGDADAFHSEYIVRITESGSQVPWHAVQALTRLAADVKKTVLLCDVSGYDDGDVMEEATGEPTLTHGRYSHHGRTYDVHAVLIRYWDTADVDKDREAYEFTPQPVVLKKAARKATGARKTT